jgi:hypothetical protein
MFAMVAAVIKGGGGDRNFECGGVRLAYNIILTWGSLELGNGSKVSKVFFPVPAACTNFVASLCNGGPLLQLNTGFLFCFN